MNKVVYEPGTKWLVKNILTGNYLYRIQIPPNSETGEGCVWGPDESLALDLHAQDMALVVCDLWNITIYCCIPVQLVDKESYN